MKLPSFFHLMKQFQGKMQSSAFTGLETNLQHAAFLRKMEQDLKREESLSTPLQELDVVVLDLETTGFFPEKGDQILSIGAVKVHGMQIEEKHTFYSFVQYEGEIPVDVKKLTGIVEEDVRAAPPISEVLIRFYQFAENRTLVAHHANHEKNFLTKANKEHFRIPFKHRIVDTAMLFQLVQREQIAVSLDECCRFFSIPVQKRHHALEDAKMTAAIWCEYVKMFVESGYKTLMDVFIKLSQLKQGARR
ncbi:DNA polymerase III subunit epsilon [Bacillaceae bacterium ZC4]|nr:DNA polymerase III subunit epsilon [Bacillaceae bacterium ZC4]AXI38834.1 DNA polymerase III subunit epsilon [Bacillaceae bacterium ZC4]